MGKKLKCSSCSSGWCKNHLLELIPMKHADCYYRKKMHLRLCPKFNQSTNQFQKTLPLINEDRKFYTPCFILDEQKTYYNDNDQKLLNTHKLKLQSAGEGTIYIAKHGRKKNYCSVCKQDYEDYLEHTGTQAHKQCLRNNKYSRYIFQTEKEIRQIQEKVFKEPEIVLQNKLVDETNDQETTNKIHTL